MTQKDIQDAINSNQKSINGICFILASGGLIYSIKVLLSYELTYSLILIGSTTLSWFLSLFYGIIYLLNKGKYLSAAEYATKDNPVDIGKYKAPKYFERQVYLLIIGGGLFLLWLVWLFYFL
ncbi:unnamed protein product [marine sediment metagenome]|uniref:DUF3899 domain-containing protein n=1 Tax=marine sediment metagenome TaxID=412755 RepID=X1T6S4_9ZZZZ